MTFEEFEAEVGRISLELPDELFNKLTGGVVVQPNEKLHKLSVDGSPLYIAGEYMNYHSMRCVFIYYGSFMRLYGRMSRERICEHIREVLLHELRHHWESLAGERDLEIEDEEHLAMYIDSVREREADMSSRPAINEEKPEPEPEQGPAPEPMGSYGGGELLDAEYASRTYYDGLSHTYGEGRDPYDSGANGDPYGGEND